MHLKYENCVPKLTKHFRGKFFVQATPKGDPENKDGSNNEGHNVIGEHILEEDQHTQTNFSASQKRNKQTKASANGSQKRQKRARDDDGNGQQSRFTGAKFIDTDDPFNVGKVEWERIGVDMERSNNTVPVEICATLRNFATYCHTLKASDWKVWTLLLSPIYLKGVLQEPHYTEYMNFVEAIRLDEKYDISDTDVDEIELRYTRFSAYYEKFYYQFDYKKLSATLPVMHEIRHNAQTIRAVGHLHIGEQWTAEEEGGFIAASAKSTVLPNQNIANNLLVREQQNVLRFLMPPNIRNEM